jgi:hypothetical protein
VSDVGLPSRKWRASPVVALVAAAAKAAYRGGRGEVVVSNEGGRWR